MADTVAVDLVHNVAFARHRIFISVWIDCATLREGADEWGRIGGVWAQDGFRNSGADAVLARGGGAGGGVVENEGAVILDREMALSARSSQPVSRKAVPGQVDA